MNGASKQEPAKAPPPAATQASCDEVPAPLPASIMGTTLPPANVTPVVMNPANASERADSDAEASDSAATVDKAAAKKKRRKPTQRPNNVRKLRQEAMMSKAELARRASVSPLTINRVENGWPCRMDTKRKILEALGLSPQAREEVFGPEPEAG